MMGAVFFELVIVYLLIFLPHSILPELVTIDPIPINSDYIYLRVIGLLGVIFFASSVKLLS